MHDAGRLPREMQCFTVQPAAKVFFNCLNGDMSEQNLFEFTIHCLAEGYEEIAHLRKLFSPRRERVRLWIDVYRCTAAHL